MSYSVNKESNGIRIILTGTLTAEDIFRCNREAFMLDHLESVQWGIWDATQVNEVKISKTDANQTAGLDATLRANQIPDGLKLALISCAEALNPIIDEYIQTMNYLNSTWECKRFCDLESAESWAKSR